MCVHARRMKEGRREKGREEGETNVCGGENAHKKDERRARIEGGGQIFL